MSPLYETIVEGGKHWSFPMRRGSTLRLTDIDGGANVGMLFYNPLNLLERYNAPDTLKCQHIFRLTKGHCLFSDMGRIFCMIIEDTYGWHDTACGSSTRALVAERWGEKTYQQHRNDWTQNGHDSFLVEAGKYGMGRRDLAANVNWFSKVAIADDGATIFDAAHARAGAAIELAFAMDTLVLMHSCPHPLDPSPVYPRRPVRVAFGRAASFPAPSSAAAERGFRNNALYDQGG